MKKPSFTGTHVLKGAFVANPLGKLIDMIARQGDDLLADAGIIIPSRAVSCILLVGDRQQVSAADIAAALEQPHQLATQRIEVLIKLGVLERSVDPADRRRKTLSLTPKGEDQYHRLYRRLGEVEQAFAGLFKEIDNDLTVMVGRAMEALERTPLLARIQANIRNENSPTNT